jgi:hypothetical protein
MLAASGVDVVLDAWSLREGQDKYHFMEQMVTDPSVTRVLVVSDRRYAERADERAGGVGTESQIISREVYEKVRQEKFVPIVTEFDSNNEPHLPTFLKNRIFLDFSSVQASASNFELLLRNIFNRPLHSKPGIGTPPSFLFSEIGGISATAPLFLTIERSMPDVRDSVRGIVADYLEAFDQNFEAIRFDPETGGPPLDERIVDSIKRFQPARDEFIQFALLLAQYRAEPELYEEIFSFLERSTRFFEWPQGVASWADEYQDNYGFVLWELFLYWIASLLERKRFGLASTFLSNLYYTHSSSASGKLRSFTTFDRGQRTLDEHRKNRLRLNRVSLTADLLRDRATHKRLTFNKLMQVDLLLFARSIMRDGEGTGDHWYPRTLVHARYSHDFELFSRGESARQLAPVLQLLGVKSADELREQFAAGAQKHRIGHWLMLGPGSENAIATMMNLQVLGTRP